MPVLHRSRAIIVAIGALAAGGVLLEATAPGVREWLRGHSFANGILVGGLLIAATYLVVERALEERERRRWSEAVGPLLYAIGAAGARVNAELERALEEGTPPVDARSGELAMLLDRYQVALTGTPELVEHWHAALSLAQHARTAQAGGTVLLGPAYEAAWNRFRTTFGDAYSFGPVVARAGETWAVLSSVPAPGTEDRARS